MRTLATEHADNRGVLDHSSFAAVEGLSLVRHPANVTYPGVTYLTINRIDSSYPGMIPMVCFEAIFAPPAATNAPVNLCTVKLAGI